jgi:uncharacterized protein YukJ
MKIIKLNLGGVNFIIDSECLVKDGKYIVSIDKTKFKIAIIGIKSDGDNAVYRAIYRNLSKQQIDDLRELIDRFNNCDSLKINVEAVSE